MLHNFWGYFSHTIFFINLWSFVDDNIWKTCSFTCYILDRHHLHVFLHLVCLIMVSFTETSSIHTRLQIKYEYIMFVICSTVTYSLSLIDTRGWHPWRNFNLLKTEEKKSGGMVKLWEEGEVKVTALSRRQKKIHRPVAVFLNLERRNLKAR